MYSDTWKIYNNYQRVGDIYVLNDTILALLASSWNTNYGGVVVVAKDGSTKIFRNCFNCPLKSNYIKSFLVSSNGNQYYGTDSGLTIYENHKWRQVTTQNSSLPNDDIYSLAEDKNGWIWIGTYRGLAKLKKDTVMATFKKTL